MAISVTEAKDSRSVSEDSAELKYIVQGTADPAEAIASVRAATPSTFNGLVLPTAAVRVEPVGDPLSPKAWRASVTYKTADRVSNENQSKPVGSISIRYSVAGEGAPCTLALEQNEYVADGVTAEGETNLIGFDGERITPITKMFPSQRLTITKTFAGTVDIDSIAAAATNLAWTTNKYAWRGYAPGRVIFEGMDANYTQSRSEGSTVDLSYNFSIGKNEDSAYSPVTGISVASKKAWDYVEVRWRKNPDKTKKVQVPERAFVNRIYEESDFATLGV